VIAVIGTATFYSNSIIETQRKDDAKMHSILSEQLEDKYEKMEQDFQKKLTQLQKTVKDSKDIKDQVEKQLVYLEKEIEKRAETQATLEKKLTDLQDDLERTESLKQDIESKLTKLESDIHKSMSDKIAAIERTLTNKTLPELEKKILRAVKESRADEERLQTEASNLKSRFDLVQLLNEFNFTTMLEVGVYEAQFASSILSKWKSFRHYYGVDLSKTTAKKRVTSNDTQVTEEEDVEEDEADENENEVAVALGEKFGKDKIKILRVDNKNVSKVFGSESIDFIYIDSKHDYCGASEELAVYYPVLKCGGLFAGHDYMFSSPDGKDWSACANGTRVHGGVKRAVIEFAKSKSVKSVRNTLEAEYSSWYFFKSC
jgi:DNA repair exonuclease SbcCD ATPase subunit